jgi:hypothetical protein
MTRRSLLIGMAAASTTSAAVAPTAISQPAAANPDAGLLALQHTFDQAVAAYWTAQRHYGDCETRYFALRPKPPQALTIGGPLGALAADKWDVLNARQLRCILDNPAQSGLWDDARAALPLAHAYEAAIRVAKRQTDVRAAKAAHDRAVDRVHAAARTVAKVPARTLSGLAVKARVIKGWGSPDWWGRGSDTFERLVAQIIDAVLAEDATAGYAVLAEDATAGSVASA